MEQLPSKQEAGSACEKAHNMYINQCYTYALFRPVSNMLLIVLRRFGSLRPLSPTPPVNIAKKTPRESHLDTISGKSFMNHPFERRIFATSYRLLLAALAALFLGQSVLAEEFVAITDIEGCREIKADAERLLCYDTIADGKAFSQKQLQQVQKENFGIRKTEPVISIDQLTVTIVDIQKASNGIYFFHTADGNVWKHSSKGSWNLPVPFQAEIKSGMLGSYFLVAETGKSTRVKRVR